MIESRCVPSDPYIGGLVAQTEIGEETGTRHIQGYVRFKTKRRFTCLKWGKIHNEVCRSVEASIEYCRKSETWDGTWRKEFGVSRKVKDPMDEVVWKEWQKELKEKLLEEPDRRTIHWYWSREGGVGKTALAIHLIMKLGAIMVGGRAGDMKCALAGIEKSGNPLPEIIILNVARSQGSVISYKGLEEIKDGAFFSSKYESKMMLMAPPHILVFANEEPDMETMSSDRWHIVNVDDEREEAAAAASSSWCD